MSKAATGYIRAIENETSATTKEGAKLSAAEQILCYLQKREDVSYFVVYDDPNSPLITIPNRKKMVKKSVQVVDGKCIETSDAFEVDEETANYVKDKRKDLQLKDGSKIMLLLAWNTDEERRMFSLFPELISLDLTEGTNNAQRSLALLVAKDANNQTFTALRAFMPSHRTHAFQILLEHAVPYLLDKRALARTEVALTDGEAMLYNPLDCLIHHGRQQTGHHFSCCTHFLCVFHLTGRDELATITPSSRKKRSDDAQAYIELAKWWILSWMMEIESLNEYEMSEKLFTKWIKSTDTVEAIGQSTARKIQDIVLTSLMPCKEKWLRPNKMKKRNFDTHASSMAESENSVLKRDSCGPKANQSLFTSGKAMTELGD